jgi:hypothetical protein
MPILRVASMEFSTIQSYVLILAVLSVVSSMTFYYWRAYRGRLVADIRLAVQVPGSLSAQIPLETPLNRGSLRCYFTNPAGWYRGSISALDSEGNTLSRVEIPSINQYSVLGPGTINRAIVQSAGVLVITFKEESVPIHGHVEFRIDLDWNVTDIKLREALKPKVPENVRVCVRGM